MKLGALWMVAALAACAGGNSNSAQDGALNGHCFPNSTCNSGLVCTGGVCEMGIDIDAAIAHPDSTIVIVDGAPPDSFVPPDSSILPDAFIPNDGGGNPDGSVTPDGTIVIIDGSSMVDAAPTSCNPLAQTGCNTGEKCTWIDDTATTGHTGCAPAGLVVLGGACTFGAPGATGYDNCIKGDYCIGGKCELVCDPNGGTPTCDASHACQSYSGLFDTTGTATAGVCDLACNPLADNDFDGAGTAHAKTGTACSSDPAIGCYGLISRGTSTTHFTCAQPASGTETLHHRSVLTSSQLFINSCAPGYTIAFSQDAFGSNNTDCYAFCKPGDSYLGAATQAPNGISPHGCNTTDAVGAFGAVPTAVPNGTNGEHCMYSWLFELDSSGIYHPSATSNTVGICWDHSKYRYDSNGDNQVTAADAIMPPCTTLPLTSSTGALTAVDLACVSTTTGGVTFTGKPHVFRLTNLPTVPAFSHAIKR